MTIATKLLAGAALLLIATAADARWKPEYGSASADIQTWYQKQHNNIGQWCCDEADGHPFFGQYAFNKDGSVTLHLGEAGTRTLPEYMVLKGPNPTGHAVWWFVESGSQHRDYCFAPGTLG